MDRFVPYALLRSKLEKEHVPLGKPFVHPELDASGPDIMTVPARDLLAAIDAGPESWAKKGRWSVHSDTGRFFCEGKFYLPDESTPAGSAVLAMLNFGHTVSSIFYLGEGGARAACFAWSEKEGKQKAFHIPSGGSGLEYFQPVVKWRAQQTLGDEEFRSFLNGWNPRAPHAPYVKTWENHPPLDLRWTSEVHRDSEFDSVRRALGPEYPAQEWIVDALASEEHPDREFDNVRCALGLDGTETKWLADALVAYRNFLSAHPTWAMRLALEVLQGIGEPKGNPLNSKELGVTYPSREHYLMALCLPQDVATPLKLCVEALVDLDRRQEIRSETSIIVANLGLVANLLKRLAWVATAILLVLAYLAVRR